MVIKKGRFGTDPYSIFLNHGTSRTPSPTQELERDVKDAIPDKNSLSRRERGRVRA